MDFYHDERNWNSILNLRHLDSNENKSEQDKPLAQWAKVEAEREQTTLEKFCIDRDLPPSPAFLEFSAFREFIGARREKLQTRLRDALA